MTSDDAQILASAEIDADALANPVSDGKRRELTTAVARLR